jgi:hypothetical protein
VAFEEPVALKAVIVYSVAATAVVAVPEIRPVAALKLSPAGKVGEIEYPSMVPPVDKTL